MNVSVIICTHNPRIEYLRRVLEGLKTQTFPTDRWELLLVDNASREPLAAGWDLSWHPRGRHLREERLGLTSARLRGIQECTGELLIFVDDDNVLDPNYLAEACKISKDWPMLGSWSGSLVPEFEVEPEEWTRRYWEWLAIRPIHQNYWSNNYDTQYGLPYGAGLCLRKPLAEYFLKVVQADPIKLALGRKGGSLISGEDIEMVHCGRKFSLGYGLFASLKLTHIMPKQRLAESHLLKLAKGLSASDILLGRNPAPSQNTSFRAQIRHRLRELANWALMPRRDYKFYRAGVEGQREGAKMLAWLKSETKASSQAGAAAKFNGL